MDTTTVLDAYDDSGELWREIFPSLDSVPDRIKTAHTLTPAERAGLPDYVFALVAETPEGHTLRKFACVDAGNTEASLAFFEKTGAALAPELQQVVATNLKVACGWFNLTVPEWLEKAAGLGGVVGKAMTAAQVAGVGKDVSERNATVSALGPGVHTPQEVEHATVLRKFGGEASPGPGTNLSNPPQGGVKLPEARFVRHIHPVDGLRSALPEGKPKPVYAKTALDGRYPLDSYVEVKTASRYLAEHWTDFSPEDRRKYACALVARADEIGLPVETRVRDYAAPTYAAPEHLKIARDLRADLLKGDDEKTLLDLVFSKTASLAPEDFARLLGEFDEKTALSRFYGRHVPDPYSSTFAETKVAEFTDSSGGDYVTQADLEHLARSAPPVLRRSFDEDLIKRLRADPVGTYKGLSKSLRQVVARVARDQADRGT